MAVRTSLPKPSDPPSRLAGRLRLALADGAGEVAPLPWSGSSRGFELETAWAELDDGWEALLHVRSLIDRPAGCSLRIALDLGSELERLMVPGVVYGVERDARALAADRSSHSCVIGWSAAASACLAAEETTALGPTGLGWEGSELRLALPASEDPVGHDGRQLPGPPLVWLHPWRAGEEANIRFRVLVGGPEPHAYDAMLRSLHSWHAGRDGLRPWLRIHEAEDLAAHGLLRWHYDAGHVLLRETAAFERGWDEDGRVEGDREAMHVAWLSGLPAASALLERGRRRGDAGALEAGLAVIDKIAGGLAPCGLFWGQWTLDEGWRAGWTAKPWLHSRTAAEAALFLGRAIRAEARLGHAHPDWERALRSNLDVSLGAQAASGAFPDLFDAATGRPSGHDTCAGLLWTAVLAGEGELPAAERAGAHYERFLEEERLWGAPEDVPAGVSSEDGYNAVIAYTALWRATGSQRWLADARRAAEWTFSFRWAYNLRWPDHTLLASYDFRSRGADVASPQNQHLHSYGLVCLPELVELTRASGDPHYLERARDNLACFRQFLARADGDFNARRGMASERFYNTRSFGPKGALLPVSHAWCLGLLLHACLEAERLPELSEA